MVTPDKPQRLSSPFLNRLVEAFPGGVAYLDRNLVFTYCNDLQASYFGRDAAAMIGQGLHDVVPNNPEFWREIERVAETGVALPQTALDITWSDRVAEGEHHYLVSYVADLDTHGGVRGVFMTALEMTYVTVHDNATESRLRERNRVLEQTVRERDLLVGIISHEIRTPLTTIFGNAHLLLRRLEDMDTDSRTRAISDIRSEAERLNSLVENMLLLARAGGQEAVPMEPVVIGRALNAAVLEHGERFVERAVSLAVKPRGLMAEAQPDYLKQVVQNLLSNAEKYSPAETAIDVRAHRKGNEVIVSVLDHGSGVALNEREIIFQAFYRSGRTSGDVGGAGIGLAVCKLLVQAQSGRLWVEARRGGGSIFSFTLPAVA